METDTAATGQVSRTAAQVYDAFFVPALFAEWAAPLCDAAGLKPGGRVLDVACGTGATTRAALARVAPDGAVTGLDRNPDMLAVARATSGIDWIEAQAEALPFGAASFDAVLCQFGLMFFEDKPRALRQMAQAVRPGGVVALSVWDRAGHSPGYAAMIGLIERLFGARVADALRAPFVLGDTAVLSGLLEDAGLDGARRTTRQGTARFPSIDDWVRIDVRGWTLSDRIDDAQFERLLAAARTELAGFADADGQVAFAAPAHIVTWTRPG